MKLRLKSGLNSVIYRTIISLPWDVVEATLEHNGKTLIS